MVYYFIIGTDGNRYGPADIDTLVQWTREGRIVASTTLIERGTERQVTADSITAIVAELRRQSGQDSPVSIERGDQVTTEAPTMTQAGRNDAAPIPKVPQIPTAPGAAPPPTSPAAFAYGAKPVSAKSKLVAGLLGIFLGGFGVHRFYLGHIGIGIIQILVTLVSCGWGSIWGLVEGIICLCGGMRDADGLELRD
ncbi:MAG: TM2 domain-containing protein [Phycisphaerales bacterium]|nr:TM2 domain-containing protein [Phycisphaerales bacterium]